MLGLRINGPADVFCDNQQVVTNGSIPSSGLNNKHNSIFITGFNKRIQLVRYKLDGYQVSIINLILVQRQQYLGREYTS